MKPDHSVYPDLDRPPLEPGDLATLEDRADYPQRVCAQWDYGIIPEPATFQLLARWREVFERFPLSHSAAYHTFRFWFGWEAVAGRTLRASYEVDDLREGRADPCALYT
ncbi:MAG: hypothetical protein M5U12_23105 [Verrucomicrobia bacterium]|nr:hypothetical protein [Verrucomicrobiota bacterium]